MDGLNHTDYGRADPRQSCFRKVAYGSERGARASSTRINERADGAVTWAYACRHCGQWHIGRRPGVTSSPIPRSSGPRPRSWRHRGRGVG